jgi:hypothetical protein
MTETRRVSLDDELLVGMQHALFEIVWPLFPWIRRLWIRESDGHFHLFVEMAAVPNKKTSDNVAHHIKRTLDAVGQGLDELFPGPKHLMEHTIQYGRSVPRNHGYRVLMSDGVFKRIAKEVAPWRLEDGR